MKESEMLAFDQINEFLYKFVMDMGEDHCFDTFAVSLSYSYEYKKDHTLSVEVFEIDPCYQTISWFNDWWEGQRYITLIGYMNVTETFESGDYHVYIKEFNDLNGLGREDK